MSYQIVLLGLLAEKPRYGYELKQVIESRSFSQYVRLSGGGLYYNLHKLLEEGYIEEQEATYDSNYPDRHVYNITYAGQNYLMQLLQTTLNDVVGRRFYDPLDAALAFGFLLPKTELIGRLHFQYDQVRSQLASLEALHEVQQTLGVRIDPYAQLIVEHALERTRSDLSWLEKTLAHLQQDQVFEQDWRRTVQCNAVPSGLSDNLDDLQEPSSVAEEQAARPTDKAALSQDVTTFQLATFAAQEKYRKAIARAWQAYERVLANPIRRSEDALQQASLDYQQEIDVAWQQLQQKLAALKKDLVAEARTHTHLPHS